MARVLTRPQVWVDGTPLSGLASWGDLKITNRWPYGCWETSFGIRVRKAQRYSQLVPGKRVEIRYGVTPIWGGELGEPDWNTGEMIALGYARQAEETICFDGTNQTTTIPDTAIDRGIALGGLRGWVRRSSISAAAYSGSSSTDRLNYLKPLLDAFVTTSTTLTGWGVNGRGEVYVAGPPTTPTWLVAPDSGILTTVDPKLAGAVFGRYQSSTTNRLETASRGSGGPQVGFGMAKLGPMTQAAAESKLDGLLLSLGALRGWGNGLELTAQQITNLGGAQANLALVMANGLQSMRLLSLRDERGVTASTEITLGETVWSVDDETIDCNPLGLVSRDLASLAEDNGIEILA